MTLLENIWIFVALSLIVTIILNNPKNSIVNTGKDQFSNVFTSAVDKQSFLQQFTWILVLFFFLLTLSLSYF